MTLPRATLLAQVPLQEVPEAALAPWLRRQAADGWTLVGLEQTAESVPLQVRCTVHPSM